MTAKVSISFPVSPWMVPIAVLLTVMLFTGCSSNKESSSVEATRMLEEASEQRDDLRLLMLADSLAKAHKIKAGESYFWQGMAHYRKGNMSLAEFYWQESLNVTANSTNATDLAYYAKSASYLSSKYCRYGEFAMALQTSLPAVKRLEQLECDTTSDYTNLVILTRTGVRGRGHRIFQRPPAVALYRRTQRGREPPARAVRRRPHHRNPDIPVVK